MNKYHIKKCSKSIDNDKIINRNLINLEWSNTLKMGENEIEFEDVRYTSCKFMNIDFYQINFDNVIFRNCIFENCNFIKGKISLMHFLKFQGCAMDNVHITNCEFESLYIKECKLYKVDFENSFMKGCNLIKNSYIQVRFIDDCNLMDCVIKDIFGFMDIRFINEKSYTKLNYSSYIGKFNYGKEGKCDFKCNNMLDYGCKEKINYLNISFSYMDFAEQFLRNHISGKYGRCFYKSKSAFHKTLKGRRKVYSYIANIVCGYGERPYRSFLLSLIIILIFALLYMIIGIESSSGIIGIKTLQDNFSIKELLWNIIYCIHFSLVTFSTVGYGNLLPCNITGVILSSIEILIGIIMVGILTSTLVRKMTR